MDPSWARPIHWQEGTGTKFTELMLCGLPNAGNNALSDRVLPAISAGPTAKVEFISAWAPFCRLLILLRGEIAEEITVKMGLA